MKILLLNPFLFFSWRRINQFLYAISPSQIAFFGGVLFVTASLLLAGVEYFDQKKFYQNQSQSIANELEQLVANRSTELQENADLFQYADGLIGNAIINHVSLTQKDPAFFATGIAQVFKESEWQAWLSEKRQAGYENLDESFFNLTNTAPTFDNNQRVIISQVFPFQPLVQSLLAKNLNQLPYFEEKLSRLDQSGQPQTLLINHLNEPLLMLIWRSTQKSIAKEAHLNNDARFTFSIYRLTTLLNDVLDKHLAMQWVSATLIDTHLNQYSLNANYLSLPLQVSKNPIQIDLQGLPLQLQITHQSWTVLSWTNILFKAFMLTFFILVILFIYKAYQNYTLKLMMEGNRLNEFMHAAHDAIILTNESGTIQNWNPSAATLFGYRHTEVLGKKIQDIITTSASEDVLKSSDFFNKKSFKVRSKLIRRNQSLIDCEIAISKLSVDSHHELAFFIEDISERHHQEQEIKRLAFYDNLTGLENRTYFSNKVSELLSEGLSTTSALLFIDLDGFKKVNDSLGHSVGDELLKIVALRFQNAIRTHERNTHLCRFGGDEFIFFLDKVTPEAAQKTTLRILKQLQKIIKIDQHEIQISCSIGIALYPQHGQNLDNLMRHADSAMYHSKFKGKNTYTIYEERMEEKLSQHLLIEKHLRFALSHNEFELFYQPQINTQTLKVVGVEALIRWNSKELGFIPPDMFISIAEESGQILAIGDWVIQAAINQLLAWQETPLQHLQIAINISAQQLEQKNLADKLHQALQAAKLPSHLLEVELTERSIMSNAQSNIELFNDLRAKGLSLSVDDFGTGYSSLSYLKRFPLNILKVDKSFVDGLPGDEDDASISSSIIQLAHSLKMKVVAEGVETREQFEFLRAHNCDMVQGYLFSKPINALQFAEWFRLHQAGFKLKELDFS